MCRLEEFTAFLTLLPHLPFPRCPLLPGALVLFRLALLRVVLLVLTLVLPRGMLHALETFWCHLFTYLLLGTRFFNTFFVGEYKKNVPFSSHFRRELHFPQGRGVNAREMVRESCCG